METRDRIDLKFIKEYYDYGSEAHIHEVSDGIFKEFYSSLDDVDLLLKKNILTYLVDQDTLKEYYPEIKYLVESSNYKLLLGFVMEKKEGKMFNNSSLSTTQKIDALLQTKEIIKKFNEKYLYILDLYPQNIRIDNNGKVFLLDVDSIALGKNIPSRVRKITYKYLFKGGKDRIGLQNIILNQFTNEILENNIEYDNDGLQIIKKIKRAKHNTIADTELLIDHIKR